MVPVARISEMVIEPLDDEVIIHDLFYQQSYRLNWVTAKVLELCDGKNTIQEIAQKLEKVGASHFCKLTKNTG